MSDLYLLLDAGGTLVFPDEELMAEVAKEEGAALDPARLHAAHFFMVHQYDSRQRSTGAPVAISLPEFFRDMLMYAGAAESVAERVVERLAARHVETSLWTYTKPWVPETLASLHAAGVRMSVISNSDGRVKEQLEACGLTRYLEAVFDSDIVGVEKPDARLFQHALGELGLHPGEALYVGDNYHVDVAGANGAGLGAVHLDPLALYADWPGVHLRDIRDLPAWLAAFAAAPAAFDLFPATNGRRASQID